MLKSLRIKNVALIPELVIEFSDGLNILSGETGAGKSVIADSLGFVLGERAETALIRQGEDLMTAEAVFDTPPPDILSELGIESDDLLIIKRTLNRAGKSDIFINGQHATAAMLKRVTGLLIDIYGQSEHSGLLKPAMHLEMIDSFGEDIARAKQAVSDAFSDYKKTEKELKSFGGDAVSRERQIDLLSYQINEIERAKITEGEEEELLALRTRIVNTEKILAALKAARQSLENENGALDKTRLAAAALNPAAAVDGEIEALRQRIICSRHELDDITATLRDIAESLDYDEKTADKIENRLQEIRLLRKKYGSTVSAINDFLDRARIEYERLTTAEETIAEKTKLLESQKVRLYDLSLSLSAARRETAIRLETEIKSELGDLGLSGGGLRLNFEPIADIENVAFTANGLDRAEFLFSANKGEDLRPLAKIISGGEMSRFMLAVKNVTARMFSLPTMFFDEIDAGISGRIAERVALKLATISRDYQVISITHLPQIAAMGDANFLIEKSVSGEKTITSVKRLGETEKIDEVARLSGGADTTTTAHKHAKELIEWSKKAKGQTK